MPLVIAEYSTAAFMHLHTRLIRLLILSNCRMQCLSLAKLVSSGQWHHHQLLCDAGPASIPPIYHASLTIVQLSAEVPLQRCSLTACVCGERQCCMPWHSSIWPTAEAASLLLCQSSHSWRWLSEHGCDWPPLKGSSISAICGSSIS